MFHIAARAVLNIQLAESICLWKLPSEKISQSKMP